ncbi:MAG: adenylyltransferase/cytidyltransferase family protein [Patescibacteria group bacterium]|nr:adenylyltransferase/cytidyltransferase family protein [Patescibacteria group bacterium]
MKGLYLGRFQPFHIGHLRVANNLLSLFPNIKIKIGVADWRGKPNRNLFLTGDESKRIAEAALADLEMDMQVVTVPIIPGDSLEKTIADFVKKENIEAVFSGSSNTLEACNNLIGQGLHLILCRIIDNEGESIRGTNLREMILQGSQEWRKYMTSSSAEILDSYNPRQRLSDLSDGQKRPWISDVEAPGNHFGSERK